MTQTTAGTKTSTHYLVQYPGGGYDGCIWEWNFCMIDAPTIKQATTFINMSSSGYLGCEDLSELRTVVDSSLSKHFVYDLASAEGIEEFDRKANPIYVIAVAKFLVEHDELEELAFLPTCDECEEELSYDIEYVAGRAEMFLASVHGCGGIATTADKKLCRACASKNAYKGWIREWFVSELTDKLDDGSIEGALDDLSKGEIDTLFWRALYKCNGEFEGSPDDMELYGGEAMIEYLAGNWEHVLYEVFNKDNQQEIEFKQAELV